jgi:hypothetical protein
MDVEGRRVSAHLHAYLPAVDGVARCIGGDSVLEDNGDGRWVEQLEKAPPTPVGGTESRIARERARRKNAEENWTQLAEWALSEYLSAISAAQVRATGFAHTSTFRSAGATVMHAGIASYLERKFGARPPEPKVEKLRKRVARAIETDRVPESWLERLGEPGTGAPGCLTRREAVRASRSRAGRSSRGKRRPATRVRERGSAG